MQFNEQASGKKELLETIRGRNLKKNYTQLKAIHIWETLETAIKSFLFKVSEIM